MTAGRPRRRKRWWLLFAGLLLVGAPAAAFAQDEALGGKFRTGDEVVVGSGETVEGDLYASAGTVRIDGRVDGDVVAAGGQVEIGGEVGGDVIAGSGGVDISGDVTGDVRAGAGDVTVSGSIGEDLLAGAGQVTITSSGTVGEDFVFGAGRVQMDGRIEGNVLGGTGSYTRNGTVGGTEDVTVSEPEAEREPSFGDRAADAIRRFVALMAVAALLLWLLPWTIERTAQTLRERPVPSIGFGALGLAGSIVVYIVTIVVAIFAAIILGLLTLGELVALIVIGVIVGLIVFSFVLYVVFAYVAPAAVGLAVAGIAGGRMSGATRWALLALGVLGVVIVTSIPVVGGWLGFLIALFGLGALILTANQRRRRTLPPPPSPPPPVPAPVPSA